MTNAGPARAKGNAAALVQARAETSARKHHDVVAALATAAGRGEALTVSALAAAAGVSRQFLYSSPELMNGLRRHQKRHSAAATAPLRASRMTDLINALDTVKRLRCEVRDLNLKLDAGLAAQIELRDERRLRQLYEQRGQEIDRLIAHNTDLSRSVTQLQETIRALEDDLTVERTALRDVMGHPSSVARLRFGDANSRP